MSYIWLLLTSLLSCGGQLCQKQAAHQPSRRAAARWLLAAVALLGIAMLVWLGLLQHLPLSVAYPMLSLNFVLITLAAHYLYHEPVDTRHWLGIASIMAGIIAMGLAA